MDNDASLNVATQKLESSQEGIEKGTKTSFFEGHRDTEKMNASCHLLSNNDSQSSGSQLSKHAKPSRSTFQITGHFASVQLAYVAGK